MVKRTRQNRFCTEAYRIGLLTLLQAYSGAVNRLKSPKIAQNRGLKLSNFS
jgi:hypothetical protein